MKSAPSNLLMPPCRQGLVRASGGRQGASGGVRGAPGGGMAPIEAMGIRRSSRYWGVRWGWEGGWYYRYPPH